MNPRLLIALALVLASVAWLQWQDAPEEDVGLLAAPRSSAARPVSAASKVESVADQDRQRLAAAWAVWSARQARSRTTGVGSAPTWLTAAPPEPPRPQRAEAPPPPMAPRFPHQWVGRFDDEAVPGQPATQRAVLQGRQETWVVQVGDVIESTWRVDRVQARVMQLTYLPLGQTQTVTLR